MLPTIEGATLRLRSLTLDDVDAVFRLYADKEATRFGYQPKMDDLADATTLVRQIQELAEAGDILHWGVARRSDDLIVGHATLFAFEKRGMRAEVGYSVQKDFWGKGLGTEALGILVRHAFEDRGLRRLEADVDPRNVGSLRILERNGFVQEGYLRERWEIDGDIQDSVLFGLLVRDWRAAIKALASASRETQ
jgi:ribosomal-protein-alanine N-acetyltransferase